MGEFGIGHVILLVALWYFVLRPMLSGYKRGRSGDEDFNSEVEKNAPALRRWPSLGGYEFEVVGESNYQQQLARLAGNHGSHSANVECVAQLVPDDFNEFDPKAIAVQVLGNTVGYLSREDARSFRRRLEQKGWTGSTTTCDALVVGGGIRRNGDKLFYGIRLDLKPFR
jgi:hypothetical protein